MKLLMTADAVGGVWTYATELAGALVPFGVQTTIAVLGPASPSPFRGYAAPSLSQGEREGARSAQPSGKGEGETTPNFSIIDTRLPLDWLADHPAPVRAAADAIATLARDLGADIVHLNSPALACAAFDGPVVAVEHGSIAPWWEAACGSPLPDRFAWHAALVREGLGRADAVITPSASYAATVQRRYGLDRPPLAVHNGRAPLPLKDRPPADHALTAGRLWDRVKRTDLLDRVAELTPIRAAGPVTAPHGETVAPEHLRLLGNLPPDALAEELAARPVFVSAASFEPFGLAVLEAAQAGCPLVLSDIATFRELWDGAALFVAGEEPQLWADAIAHARADRDALGHAARERARRYTPEATARAMLAIYERLLTPTQLIPSHRFSTSLETNGGGVTKPPLTPPSSAHPLSAPPSSPPPSSPPALPAPPSSPPPFVSSEVEKRSSPPPSDKDGLRRTQAA